MLRLLRTCLFGPINPRHTTFALPVRGTKYLVLYDERLLPYTCCPSPNKWCPSPPLLSSHGRPGDRPPITNNARPFYQSPPSITASRCCSVTITRISGSTAVQGGPSTGRHPRKWRSPQTPKTRLGRTSLRSSVKATFWPPSIRLLLLHRSNKGRLAVWQRGGRWKPGERPH